VFCFLCLDIHTSYWWRKGSLGMVMGDGWRAV